MSPRAGSIFRSIAPPNTTIAAMQSSPSPTRCDKQPWPRACGPRNCTWCTTASIRRSLRKAIGLRGRAACDAEPNDWLILCTAALTDHKGHRYLLKAFRDLLAKRPNALLALAGDGELRQRFRATNSQPRNHVTRPFSRFSRRPARLAARVGCICLGLAHGRTVLVAARRHGGRKTDRCPRPPAAYPRRSATSRRPGWPPPRDVPAFTTALLAATDQSAARSKAAAARGRVLERFTIAHMTRRTLQVYRELRRPAPRSAPTAAFAPAS